MGGFAYAGTLGRLKVLVPEFLRKEAYVALVAAKDPLEITKVLETFGYLPELAAVAASYQGIQRLEVAINRKFVKRCRQALDAAPYAGKPMVAAYLRRWDLQNIGLILSAKAQGRPLTETETFLVSSREIPAGLFAGAMTLDDFRQLLGQTTVEGVAQQAVRYGYGAVLLPRLEAYQRTQDIFPLLQALDVEYYRMLFESIRHFQGDEWNVRSFAQSEVDVRNVLLLLKGKESQMAVESVLERFIDLGTFPKSAAGDLYGARGVPELVEALTPRFPTLPEGNGLYQEIKSLTAYEAALQRARAIRELQRLRSYPLSSAILFSFLLQAELERTDLRRVIYGKQYGLTDQQLSDELVVPRI